MFHNFHSLILRHKRSLALAHKLDPVTDPDTTKTTDQGWGTATQIEGALWFVSAKDLKKYKDFELSLSDMKLITSGTFLKTYVPQLKDKLEHSGNIYYIKKIVDQTHYGNYLIIFLTKEYAQV